MNSTCLDNVDVTITGARVATVSIALAWLSRMAESHELSVRQSPPSASPASLTGTRVCRVSRFSRPGMACRVASRSKHYEMQPATSLSLSHVSLSHTDTVQRCESGRPPSQHAAAVHHTTASLRRARTHHLHCPAESLGVHKRLDRLLARRSLTIVGKRRNSKSLGALKEMDWRNRLVTDLAFAAFCGVLPNPAYFRYPPPPASANRSAKYVCALVCAKGARLFFLWLMSSSPVFPSLDTPTIQPSFR
jgi:hypothetical protein